MAKATRLAWKRIKETYGGAAEEESKRPDKGFTYRAKVPGGWLVAVWAGENKDHRWGGGLTFVPDSDETWTVETFGR